MVKFGEIPLEASRLAPYLAPDDFVLLCARFRYTFYKSRISEVTNGVLTDKGIIFIYLERLLPTFIDWHKIALLHMFLYPGQIILEAPFPRMTRFDRIRFQIAKSTRYADSFLLLYEKCHALKSKREKYWSRQLASEHENRERIIDEYMLNTNKQFLNKESLLGLKDFKEELAELNKKTSYTFIDSFDVEKIAPVIPGGQDIEFCATMQVTRGMTGRYRYNWNSEVLFTRDGFAFMDSTNQHRYERWQDWQVVAGTKVVQLGDAILRRNEIHAEGPEWCEFRAFYSPLHEPADSILERERDLIAKLAALVQEPRELESRE